MAPLPRISAAFITGILLACLFPEAFSRQYALIVLCALLAISYIPLPLLAGKKGKAFGISTLVFSLILGVVRTGVSHHRMYHPGYSKGKTVTATVAEYAVEKEKSFATIIDCGKKGGRQMVYLWSSSDRPMELSPGDVIQFKPSHKKKVASEIKKIKSKGKEERQFLGYNEYLYYSHITTTQYARQWWKAKDNNSRKAFTWGRLRKTIADHYSTLNLPSEEEAILTAMTLGDRRALRERGMTLSNRYSRAGASHVLALSGFHLTIIYALLDIFFLTSFFRRRKKWIPHLLIIVSIWAFTLLAGSPPSLVRAATMCTIISITQTLYGGKQSGFDALVLSAFIMLLYDPFYLMNVSFQLSYASMLGITLASPALSRLQVGINKSGMPAIAKKTTSYFAGIILISIIATLSTAGLVAYHFGTVSLVGIATNICVSVMATVLMAVAVVWWLFQAVTSLCSLQQTAFGQTVNGALGDIIHWLLNGMNHTVDFFASLSHSTLQWEPSLWIALLYYVLLAALFILTKKHLHAITGRLSRK